MKHNIVINPTYINFLNFFPTKYEEMVRLRDLGADTPDGVPYTQEQILAIVLKGKQRGHLAEGGGW